MAVIEQLKINSLTARGSKLEEANVMEQVDGWNKREWRTPRKFWTIRFVFSRLFDKGTGIIKEGSVHIFRESKSPKRIKDEERNKADILLECRTAYSKNG